MGSKKYIFFFLFSSFIVVFVIAYMAIVPVVISHAYTEDVHQKARPLEASFKTLGKSTELPLITAQDASETIKNDNVTSVLRLITDSRKQLTELERVSSTLTPMPYSDVLGQYNDAEVLREHTQRLIGQSESVLDEYGTLVTYLKTFHTAVSHVASELRSFNETVDINIYSGQSDVMRQIADAIRADASLLSRSNPPGDAEGLNGLAVAAFEKAATGFDDLAYGLAVPADAPIDEAARKIESATAELERVTGEVYDGSVGKSRTLKNVSDLSDKLDLLSVR